MAGFLLTFPLFVVVRKNEQDRDAPMLIERPDGKFAVSLFTEELYAERTMAIHFPVENGAEQK